MELKTPLYDCHVAAGGKIVPFAGYLLPVQYTGVIKEHMAVRTACGLFDVSHMGEFLIKGADALNNVQNLFCNDFENMYDGQVRYSPMCNERGGIVDDVLIYKVNGEEYLLVVNAANRHKDAEMRSGLRRIFLAALLLKIFPIPLPSWHFRGRNPKKLRLKLCRKQASPKNITAL